MSRGVNAAFSVKFGMPKQIYIKYLGENGKNEGRHRKKNTKKNEEKRALVRKEVYLFLHIDLGTYNM